MTRSRKRQIEENFESIGVVVDEFGYDISHELGTSKSVKSTKNKRNEDEEPWDCNYVVEVKRRKRDESPESNPVYFRKVLTTAQVHRNMSPTPQPNTDEEKIEMELLESGETIEPKSVTPTVAHQELLDVEENDDTASDTTDQVVEDLKVLLEATKEDTPANVVPNEPNKDVPASTDLINGFSVLPFRETTPEAQIIVTPPIEVPVSVPVKSTAALNITPVVPESPIDFDKIDVLSSESILECVDV